MFVAVSSVGHLTGVESLSRPSRLVLLALFGAMVYSVVLWTIARPHVMQLRAAIGAMRR